MRQSLQQSVDEIQCNAMQSNAIQCNAVCAVAVRYSGGTIAFVLAESSQSRTTKTVHVNNRQRQAFLNPDAHLTSAFGISSVM